MTQTTIGVMGSTGSIGVQTLEVVAASQGAYKVVALAAGSDLKTLIEQVDQFRPEYVTIGDRSKLPELASKCPNHVTVVDSEDALFEMAAIADVTVNAVVGFAGLPVTLGCLQAGKRLALANKESLIAAGPVVQRARKVDGAELIPVDSEHGAIHQCLAINPKAERVDELLLTASGGPFRGRSADDLRQVTIDDALNHPTWSMGPKITVDSSTLMNKGLEVIEAHELFGTPAGGAGVGIGFDEINVVVHPQSIVHSMVTYSDGSTIAQLSRPDMRLPIGYALAYPDRLPFPHGRIDWRQSATLEFEPPDRAAFPCLDLAYAAGRAGGTAPTWLSAANEVAVEAFLAGRIDWVDIPGVIGDVLDGHDNGPAESVGDILEADSMARKRASAVVAKSERATS